MFQSAVLRPVLGLPLAGLVVLGLFSFMQKMIDSDFVPPEEKPHRDLQVLVAAPHDPDRPIIRDRKPKPLDVADRPPPPPKLRAGPTDIDLPMQDFSGSVPGRLEVGRLGDMTFDTIVIDARDAKPISPPLPTYPQELASRQIEGDCEVRFSVDTRGRPFDVEAACTHPGFQREAERAVSKVLFAPMLRKGQAMERRNVIYPIAFRLDG